MDGFFGEKGTRSVSLKVAMDIFVAIPLVDIPAFYICTVGPRVGLRVAIQRLKDDYYSAVVHGTILWLPVNFFVLAICPRHLRVPVFYAVDTLWAFCLSYRSNATDDSRKPTSSQV